MPTLAASALERRFGAVAALRGASITVSGGELVLLLGPNGAGKTTLLRCLAGLVRPTRGEIRLDDTAVRGASHRGAIGLLSHLPAVYDDLTAHENLVFAARLHGVGAAAEEADRALGRAGLRDRRDELVRGFSRGMLQRLAIARATLHAPPILLLDEPFTGLDAPAADAFRAWIDAEREAGRAIIAVTHEPSELWEQASRVAVLVAGRMVHDAPRAPSLGPFRAEYAAMLAA